MINCSGFFCCLLLLACSGLSAAVESSPVLPAYAGHPRLLFGPAEIAALADRAKQSPEMWKPVAKLAARLAANVPDEQAVREGKRYYRADWMLAGALAGSVGGDAQARAACIAWMKTHCSTAVWGVGWRENVDIPANWYMYYVALAYDLLWADISAADRKIIATGLAAHAEAVYAAWKDEKTFPYDQNHTYVPMIGLTAAALVLLDEEPRAAGWLAFTRAVMEKCRAVMPDDGWYYEGTGYWEYAFHWHVRYADLIGRATGTDAFDLPMFRTNHLYAAYLSLPGQPWLFDIGDTGYGTGKRAKEAQLGRKGMLYRLAAVHRDGAAQGVADRLRSQGGTWEDPGMTFLWYDPSVPSTPVASLPTFHHFADAGVLSWRSSWDDDATMCMFKSGPPLGYAAAGKLAAMPDWRPNTGHVHPDIGMFWLYAHGAYLATDTGYSARKRTDDHNTILVDGQGMGADNTYWIYSGFPDRDIPYATWTGAKLAKVHLEAAYAYALADFSQVYPAELGRLRIQRHFFASKDLVIVYDDLDGERPHVFTSLVHADAPFEQVAPGVMRADGLTSHVLNPQECSIINQPTVVFAGTKPHQGVDEQRGFQLSVASPAATTHQRFVNVLVPAKAGRPDPLAVELVSVDDKGLQVRVNWSTDDVRTYTIDLTWQQGVVTGPVSW